VDRKALSSAALSLEVSLNPAQCDRLQRYVELLTKWNAKFNLVSRKDMGRLWERHLLDSLSALPCVREACAHRTDTIRALDVGTGGGLPGLPLAIAAPDVKWQLLDRNARKVRFLEMVIADLRLTNVDARCVDLGRRKASAGPVAADIVPDTTVDIIVSRAVNGPAMLVDLAGGLLRPAGVMILLSGTHSASMGDKHDAPEQLASDAKGRRWVDAAKRFRVDAVREVVIPGLDRVHELTIIRHAG